MSTSKKTSPTTNSRPSSKDTPNTTNYWTPEEIEKDDRRMLAKGRAALRKLYADMEKNENK